jgi:hypothetical protein
LKTRIRFVYWNGYNRAVTLVQDVPVEGINPDIKRGASDVAHDAATYYNKKILYKLEDRTNIGGSCGPLIAVWLE